MQNGSGEGGCVTIREPSDLVVARVSATGYSMGIGGKRLHRHSPAMTFTLTGTTKEIGR